jgi:hypothetical protein
VIPEPIQEKMAWTFRWLRSFHLPLAYDDVRAFALRVVVNIGTRRRLWGTAAFCGLEACFHGTQSGESLPGDGRHNTRNACINWTQMQRGANSPRGAWDMPLT